MDATRPLFVIADDFGIGPQTSRGILDLAARGLVTGTVLLVTSPHAPRAVAEWRGAGEPLDLGWHPCLTLDRPVSPPGDVASLVGYDGRFWPLGSFLRRLFTGRIRTEDVRRELVAQLRRFVDLVGRPPSLINSHQHVSVFPAVGRVLDSLLGDTSRPVFVRRVREPWLLLRHVAGARRKRLTLNLLGRPRARRQVRAGFAGADWLAGLSDPGHAGRPDYFTRWLAHSHLGSLELMCHPGHLDSALGGRDGTPAGGSQPWRVAEYQRLADPIFAEASERAGYRRLRPSEWLDHGRRGQTHAA
jgi:predicted glycoside hydrolase/deacetylase ChbG (UPF0249 family)